MGQTREIRQGTAAVDAISLSQAFPDSLGERPESLSIQQLAGDASTRRYYRITRSDESWILQAADPFLSEDSSRHSFLSAQRILDKLALPVPAVVATDPGRGWVLQQDLGDETLQHHPRFELYERAVELMVEWTLRARANEPTISELARTAPHFGWAFDLEKLQFEMRFMAEHLIDRYLGLDLGPEFLANVEPNSAWLAACPRFFTHRDYHCRNLMVRDGSLFAIDFQDARMGPITYDLVSLLWDPYVGLSADWRTRLLAHWRSRILARGRELGVSEASCAIEEPRLRIELERMKTQRLLKAAGSYASFYNNRGRRDYLPSLLPALSDAKIALETLRTGDAFTPADERLLTVVSRLLEASQAKKVS